MGKFTAFTHTGPERLRSEDPEESGTFRRMFIETTPSMAATMLLDRSSTRKAVVNRAMYFFVVWGL